MCLAAEVVSSADLMISTLGVSYFFGDSQLQWNILLTNEEERAVAEEEGNKLRHIQTIADQLPDPPLVKFAWNYYFAPYWKYGKQNLPLK